MKIYPGIDYQYRPTNYWEDDLLLQAILRNVKGTLRREMIIDHWEAGRYEILKDELKNASLPEKVRCELGQIHPAFMGGEYLPDNRERETEIARIELKSTTYDVISIRARPKDQDILYSIVDEYESEFDIATDSSQKPFTLAELIAFIDGSTQADFAQGLALCYSDMNAESSSRKDMRHFTVVSSDVYPKLKEHYEHVFDDWVNEEEIDC